MTDASPPADLRRSPLHDLHEAAGASFTDFAGWLMPVRYDSDLAEHHAVRTTAGMFDISHMGEIEVRGRDAAAFLDFALAGWLSKVADGQAKYSLLLADDGGVIDDLVVYRLAEDRFLVVANAGNRDAVVRELGARTTGFEVEVDDVSDDTALIAVQGPASLAVLEATASLSILALADLAYYRHTDGDFDGQPLLVARTGYTGENGYELYLPVAMAADLWRALTTAGEPLGLVPAGLACRDTLRLEAGMPLYGHELGPDILPAQAGLGRVAALGKPGDFVGRRALEAGTPEGARVLVGLRAEGKRAGRAGYEAFAVDTSTGSAGEEVGSAREGVGASTGSATAEASSTGGPVGEISSGALSPTLGYPIALAFVDPASAALGTELALDVRGTRVPATVVALPFYKREQ